MMDDKSNVIIIDYGMGNILSVFNMIQFIGGKAKISSSLNDIKNAKKIILPGVGTYDAGITNLKERDLDSAIKDVISNKSASILGICLGMQLLMESSEEGKLPGLALISGSVKHFDVHDKGLKVPHMGWNVVRPTRISSLLNPDQPEQRFYFVHSYYVECKDKQDIAGFTDYGFPFTSVLEHENILGVQFHPEKSHKFGMGLLKKFLEM